METNRADNHTTELIPVTIEDEPAFVLLSATDVMYAGLDETLQRCCTVNLIIKQTILSSSLFVAHVCNMGGEYEVHGPASTGPAVVGFPFYGSQDMVYCLLVSSWPAVASDFFQRDRRSSWPPANTIANIRASSIYVVSTGPKENVLAGHGWRWSFSVPEKILMHDMTDSMAGCVFLLKVLKRVWKRECEEICSYYAKTACFWVFELKTLTGDENIVSLTDLCLDWLVCAFKDGYLPHYFIPKQNLIKHMDQLTRENIITEMENIKRNIRAYAVLGLTQSIPESNMIYKELCHLLNDRGDPEDWDDRDGQFTQTSIESCLSRMSGCPDQVICIIDKYKPGSELFRKMVHSEDISWGVENILLYTLLDITKFTPDEICRHPDDIYIEVLSMLPRMTSKYQMQTFEITYRRSFAQFYHSLGVYCREKVRDEGEVWTKAMEYCLGRSGRLYQDGLIFTHPDGTTDNGITGYVYLAYFYLSEQNWEKLKHITNQLKSLLPEALSHPAGIRYLTNTTITSDRPLSHMAWKWDTVLHQQLLTQTDEYYVTIHSVSLGLYILGWVAIHKDNDRETTVRCIEGMKAMEEYLVFPRFMKTNRILRNRLDEFIQADSEMSVASFKVLLS